MKERTISIVGAGQAGLQLALTLRRKNHSVTVFANRSPQKLLTGKILSSQGMFDSALSIERALGIDFWKNEAAQNTAFTFTLAAPHALTPGIEWQCQIPPYQSVDQRIKFSHWMELFEKEKGKLIIQDISPKDLEEITDSHDLTIVSTGKGDMCQLFPRNEQESPFKSPQRILACIYVDNVIPANPPGVRANLIPGIGEFFVIPGLTLTGNCEMMLFEGIPGGPFDCWKNATNIDEQLAIGLSLLEKYVPWEAKRFRRAKPTDQNGSLIGSYTPVVRHPTAQLSNGKYILGMGDTVVLNDPIGGQGANNACKAAQIYADCIFENSNHIYDESWMKKTFQKYWDHHGKWATKWTTMLLTPPPPHVVELLQAAAHNPSIARKIADCFDRPSLAFPWILDPAATLDMIAPKRTFALH